jgi:hypothetical protein
VGSDRRPAGFHRGEFVSTSGDFNHDFIQRKKESHRERAVDCTPESIMLAAENYSNAIKLEGE